MFIAYGRVMSWTCAFMKIRRSASTRPYGFSLFELLVVIVIISILFVVAISRLVALQVDAERVVMESVVGSLRSGLGIKVAESIVRQRIAGLPAYEASNPMNLLAEVPKNYLGELEGADLYSLEKGSWYFDLSTRTLVYLIDNTGYFSGGMDDPTRVRFKIRLVYTDTNGNGTYDSGVDAIGGLRLVVLDPYKWVK